MVNYRTATQWNKCLPVHPASIPHGALVAGGSLLPICAHDTPWCAKLIWLQKPAQRRVQLGLQLSPTNWFPVEPKIASQILHGCGVSSALGKVNKPSSIHIKCLWSSSSIETLTALRYIKRQDKNPYFKLVHETHKRHPAAYFPSREQRCIFIQAANWQRVLLDHKTKHFILTSKNDLHKHAS